MNYPDPRNRFYNARTRQYDDLESGRTSPQRTEFDWDFPTPLQRISRATSPIPIFNVVSIFPGGSRVPTPEAQEPDPIPLHPSYRQYYFEDANDEFIVEGYRFRVYRFIFDLQTTAFPKNSWIYPIPLDGVTLYEFVSLLDFLLDGMHNDRMITLLGWKSILSISTRYEMTRVRNRAIREITNFTPRIDSVDLVVLAVDHQVKAWLPIAYSRLCQRKETLTIEEGKRLGLETVCLLYRARQKVREDTTSPIDDVAEPFDRELVHQVVYEVFWPGQKVPKLEPSMNSAAAKADKGKGGKGDKKVTEKTERGTGDSSKKSQPAV